MPMAWGIFRPSVLMPADADAWPDDRLRIVLLHELAHVKRRDCLTHLFAQVACAAHWFNPLAWMAVRRLRAERERACDDLVLAAGTRGSDYANQLLEIARVMQGGRFPGVLAGASLAMAHRSQLEGRLIAILDPSVRRRGLTRLRAFAATCVFAVLLVPIAAVQPWAEERDAAVKTWVEQDLPSGAVATQTPTPHSHSDSHSDTDTDTGVPTGCHESRRKRAGQRDRWTAGRRGRRSGRARRHVRGSLYSGRKWRGRRSRELGRRSRGRRCRRRCRWRARRSGSSRRRRPRVAGRGPRPFTGQRPAHGQRADRGAEGLRQGSS